MRSSVSPSSSSCGDDAAAHIPLRLVWRWSSRSSKVANDLFYELLPEKNEAKSESEAEAATLHPPQYYEAKYEPTLRSLIRQLKAYVTREVEAAEKKEGDDPLASLLNHNTHSRRYARLFLRALSRHCSPLAVAPLPWKAERESPKGRRMNCSSAKRASCTGSLPT